MNELDLPNRIRAKKRERQETMDELRSDIRHSVSKQKKSPYMQDISTLLVHRGLPDGVAEMIIEKMAREHQTTQIKRYRHVKAWDVVGEELDSFVSNYNQRMERYVDNMHRLTGSSFYGDKDDDGNDIKRGIAHPRNVEAMYEAKRDLESYEHYHPEREGVSERLDQSHLTAGQTFFMSRAHVAASAALGTIFGAAFGAPEIGGSIGAAIGQQTSNYIPPD